MRQTAATLIIFLGLWACVTQLPKNEEPKKQIGLSWDNEIRKDWSASLLKIIDKDLDKYLVAKDIERICPKIKTLPREKQTKAIAEFWIGVFYYESSWNTKSQSVDVGFKDDKDSWSLGLAQVSVQDQWNMKVNFKYSFEDLLKPEPNIILSNAIMLRQIGLTNLIILPNSNKHRYWAVALEGNRDQKIKEILSMVAKNSECF